MSNCKATGRTQRLRYGINRTTGCFDPIELHVLNCIAEFSQKCLLTYSEIGHGCQRGARTIQRAVNRLLKKGVINVVHVVGHRSRMTLASEETQMNILRWDKANAEREKLIALGHTDLPELPPLPVPNKKKTVREKAAKVRDSLKKAGEKIFVRRGQPTTSVSEVPVTSVSSPKRTNDSEATLSESDLPTQGHGNEGSNAEVSSLLAGFWAKMKVTGEEIAEKISKKSQFTSTEWDALEMTC